MIMTKVALAVFAIFVASVSAVPKEDAAALSKKLDGLMESVKELKTEMSHADDMDDDADEMDDDVDEMSKCVASKPYRGGDLPCAPYFGDDKTLVKTCRGLSAKECPHSYALQKKTKSVNGQQKCKGDIFICRWNADKNRCGGTRFAKEQCPAPPAPPSTCPSGVVYTTAYTCATSKGVADEWGSYFGRGKKSCQCNPTASCLSQGGFDISKLEAAFGLTGNEPFKFQMIYGQEYTYTLGAYPSNKCPQLAEHINEVLNPESSDSSYTPVTCDNDKLEIYEKYCSYTMSKFNAKVMEQFNSGELD